MPTSRRSFLKTSAAIAVGSTISKQEVTSADVPPVHQATGVKVGEMTSSSAVVWTRITRDSTRVASPHRIEGQARAAEESLPAPVDELEGACPGAAGRVRVRYAPNAELSNAAATEWQAVDARADFSHSFKLTELKPDTLYHYAVETTGSDGTPHGPRRGTFRTAPVSTTPTSVLFGFINCQKFHTRESPDGFEIYESIRRLDPGFVVFTGDNVYLDSDRPRATSAALARYHWQRCYSLPRHVALLESVGSYWLKDDHDSHSDDVFPQKKKSIMGDLTFEQGLEIYRQQVPLDRPYRTIRWGRDLQFWLVEGRDFRSANNAPDGPEKSIWGRKQKEWLKRTMSESDATWKLLLSPTPLVGPDRPNKADNHSNAVFSHEGNEMRRWFAEHVGPRFFVITGDRHWQYHSVDPATGVNEFSIGAATKGNAGGTPGYDPKIHRFHLVQGGFLQIAIAPKGTGSQIVFELCDVKGKPAYRFDAEAE
jgi:alkaline phosphatase D